MKRYLRLGTALFLGFATQGSATAASTAKAPAAAGGQEQRMALYAQPVAFMSYCGMPMNEAALAETLKTAGIGASNIPAIKARAAKLVVQIEAQNDTNDKKIAFCKTSKRSPSSKNGPSPNEPTAGRRLADATCKFHSKDKML